MARPGRFSSPGSGAALGAAVFSRSQMQTLLSSPPLAKTPAMTHHLNEGHDALSDDCAEPSDLQAMQWEMLQLQLAVLAG